MRIANFVELPQDEYGNRSYTNGQAWVIRARIEGEVLYILEPENWAWSFFPKNIWTNSWKEVNHPAGEISNEEWRELVELPKSDR